MKKAAFSMALLAVASTAVMAQTELYKDPSVHPHERAKDMVSRLTLDQKINQIGHQTNMVASVGLPGYNYWNEALHGVARSGLATSFPSSKAMSSTWNLPLIYQCAWATSTEARIYYNDNNKGLIYWCPTINMSRDPRWGRDEENYGEDPFLTGRMAVAYIKGMQGDDGQEHKYFKTIATAKHFAANNYEKGRHSTSSEVNARDLREYYLPAFEMAVKEGNVRSVMSAYNRLNGIPCGANHELLIDILRNEWGFNGFVTSDCAAVDDVWQSNRHHYVNTGEEACAVSLQNGEDLNCGSTFQTYCKKAIEQGLMTEADVDSALVRVLEARFAVGEFDKAQTEWNAVSSDSLHCDKHIQLSLDAARQAIVLLKNENNFLPLKKDKTVAIIGPMGNNIQLGGYSGSPSDQTTLFEAVSLVKDFTLSDGTVQFEDNDDQSVPSSNKRITHESNGSAGNLGYLYNNDWTSYNNVNLGAGMTKLTVYHGAKNNNATIAHFYLDSMDGEPLVSVTCPVTGNWSKYIETTVDVDPAKAQGVHTIYVKYEGGTNGDRYCANMDWFRFFNPDAANPLEENGPVYLYQGCGITGACTDDKIARAKEIAAKADYVIFAAGTDLSVSDESNDRTSLNLPGKQQQLLEAVVEANPNTVLVLQTCSSMTVNWAKEHCPAIIEAWYGGQKQGQAISDVLYGDFNPCGKLTSTWYANLSDLPSGMLNYDIRSAGYTYMYHKKTPLFAFGHGLSYTTYEYSNLQVSKSNLALGEKATVTATVKNTGSVAGAEVVQLYAHVNSQIERPQLQLVGFARVELAPGESKTVEIEIAHDQFSYFNETNNTFDVEAGTVDLHLAAASDDLRLSTQITTEAATVKTTYKTTGAGIANLMKDNKLSSDFIYNLSGIKVGRTEDFDRLPAGFYILGGQKIVKK